MKKFLLLVLVAGAAQIGKAQSSDTIPTRTDSSTQSGKTKPYEGKGAYITLQAGQVMLVKNNRAEKLTADKTLKDGTVVSLDGKIRKPNGAISQLKEGDRLYIDGGMTASSRDMQ